MQSDTFFMQLADALSNKERLLRGVFTHDEHRPSAGFASRGEFFGELFRVGGYRSVGDGQNFGSAAVIGFDFVYFGLGVTLRKFEDVLIVRAAPGVNALG